MAKLAKTRTGRVLVHLLVVLSSAFHFQAPHFGFAFKGILREIKGV